MSDCDCLLLYVTNNTFA